LGRVPSVPGGSHWGAGVSISARDQALVGQLLLDDGMAAGRALLPRDCLRKMAEPCAIAPFYGRLLWLNRDGRAFPGASTRAVFMVGAGGHYVGIDPELDAVVTLRWLDPAHVAEAMPRFADALRGL
jgi:CubicO group peptidase (beta-lactamase class C family)